MLSDIQTSVLILAKNEVWSYSEQQCGSLTEVFHSFTPGQVQDNALNFATTTSFHIISNLLFRTIIRNVV
jgi:hypothetical protein